MATVAELLDEAMAVLDLVERDERAARLFVVAAKLVATGDAVAAAEARALLAKAADDGPPLAAFGGGEVDTAGGLSWLGRAATELPSAATMLGGMLFFDPDSAVDGITWLRRARRRRASRPRSGSSALRTCAGSALPSTRGRRAY